MLHPFVPIGVDELWVLVIGAIVPLVSYPLNYFGPHVSEPVKAAVHAVVSALAAGLYTALATHVFGWNEPTLLLEASAILATFTSHHWIWLPSGVSALLGGGQNKPAVGASR